MRRPPRPLVTGVLAGLWLAAAAGAHEVRPAYLELTETERGRFDVLWKQPLRPSPDAATLGLGLPLAPRLEPPCRTADPPRKEGGGGALLQRWSIDCGAAGLEGRTLEVDGLTRTLTDALVRLRFLDGEETVEILKPRSPRLEIGAESAAGVWTYLRLGVEHLLFGVDHILFVIGLMFFVRRPLELLKVVTAFTVAHSITLALSTLGLVRLSQAPVEALIALTILYLAVELLREPAGRERRRPWAIAFGFGLLHGFGFAGALAEIGLPREAVAPALFLFNLGVEAGQLLVVASILALLALLRVTRATVPAAVAQLPIWILGSVSAYWFVERVARLL